MNVLLLGSGGREHAFAVKLLESPQLSQLWIAPGNAGTAEIGQNVELDITDFQSILEFVLENKINLLIPASEDPLVSGIVDFFTEYNQSHNTNIMVAGPKKQAARLEGSKDFSKSFMLRNGIPTAKSITVSEDNLDEGFEFINRLNPPYVLKADGLAAGKGVIITESLTEAKDTLTNMVSGLQFGKASEKVVIEEYLEGIEISVFAISDGSNWKTLASAKDYKRIGEGDTGLNTGGMGAISPVPFADEVFMKKVHDQILEPTFKGMIKEGNPFTGFLFVGLMNCGGDPYVIEYNVRMGDPETEVIFPRLKTDLLSILVSMCLGDFQNLSLKLDARTAACVFLVSGGYPGSYEKGKEIALPGFEEDVTLFHAGTKLHNSTILTNGGRVIAVTAIEENISTAVNKALDAAEKVNFEGKYYRKDIGQDLINLTENK